jgi:N-acyl homoserine lactone hydrolase
MKEYKIKPLLTGYFHMDWGNVCAPLLGGYIADLPVFMFLIEGKGGEQIIVDAGFDPETTTAKWIFNPVPRKPNEEVLAVLKRNKVNPDKIKTVIITHLHHDHTGYMKLFKNARFIVQETELLETTYPVGTQAVGVAHADWVDLVPRFRLVNGDFHLQEGIDLILAPGHTPGHQAVMVNTSKGKAMLLGDSAYLLGGFAKRFPKQFADLIQKTMSVKHAPVDFTAPEAQKDIANIFGARYGGFFGPCILNPGQNVQSMSKLDMMADILLPSHDLQMLKWKVIPDDYDLFDEEVR